MTDATITIRIKRPSASDPRGYLGASVSYPPRAGEDWERGTDLADGRCDDATLRAIMEDVRAVMEGYRRAYERDAV